MVGLARGRRGQGEKYDLCVCVCLGRNRDMTSAQPSPGDKDPIPSHNTKIWIIFHHNGWLEDNNNNTMRLTRARLSFPRPFANGVCPLVLTPSRHGLPVMGKGTKGGGRPEAELPKG